ncbi:proton extrusion protein PcxA [Richelia sinica FACHB-800]|nr:proton extrusion protein PcxA [Richelia sinica FACHB-800]
MKVPSFRINTAFIRHKMKHSWHLWNRWLMTTPIRALTEAYTSAQLIRNIEIEHFNGQKITVDSDKLSESVMTYWQGCLQRNLNNINIRLTEFQLSRSFIKNDDIDFLEKLKFIDEVINKYKSQDEEIELSPGTSTIIESNPTNLTINNGTSSENNIHASKLPKISQKTGIFPRSIGRTFKRISRDLSPRAEQDILKNYAVSRNRTKRSVRFLILLIIVPLLTQNISKIVLINPMVERVRGEAAAQIFINTDMEEEAFKEIRHFEAILKLEKLINPTLEITPEVIEAKVKEKAVEIAAASRKKSSNAISNAFADVLSLISFALVIFFSKKDIVFLKSFMDEIVYGLSDSAKAFLIILFTDIFVGFHSPHGWEVILEGLAEHLGLAANRNGIFLFIATFPVILDTIFKYWIFRYLSRLSPSALATLKEMNE